MMSTNWIFGSSNILLYQLSFLTVINCDPGGGRCLSSAQYKCFNSSTQLMISITLHPTDIYKICSDVSEYHICMKSQIAKCSITEQERQLYQTDIVDTYTNQPYHCKLSHSVAGWAEKVNGGQKLFSSLYHRLYICLFILVYITKIKII